MDLVGCFIFVKTAIGWVITFNGLDTIDQALLGVGLCMNELIAGCQVATPNTN